MCRQTMAVLPCMHIGFPTKLMEQMIVTSLYDVMRISHAREGGKYKRESITKPKELQLLLLLSSGCFDISIRVFTKLQTLYLSCLGAPQVGSISWMYSVVCFSHKHASRPIWRNLSYYNLVYLVLTRQTTTSSP